MFNSNQQSTLTVETFRQLWTTALPLKRGIRCFTSFYRWKIKLLYLFLHLQIQISPQNHNCNALNVFLPSIAIIMQGQRKIIRIIGCDSTNCFEDRIGRGFYIASWPATENGSTAIIQSAENHGECPDMPPRRQPDRIFMVPRLCSEFGGTSSTWHIMSCWNRVKLSQGIGIEGNWCIWAEHWKRNGHNTKRDTIKLSSSMTILGHMLADQHFDSHKDVWKWLDEWLLRNRSFLAWNPQTARDMGKMCS